MYNVAIEKGGKTIKKIKKKVINIKDSAEANIKDKIPIIVKWTEGTEKKMKKIFLKSSARIIDVLRIINMVKKKNGALSTFCFLDNFILKPGQKIGDISDSCSTTGLVLVLMTMNTFG